MYDYTICSEPDEEIFRKQCRSFEKHIPNLEKEELLVDVDSSKTQIYVKDGKKIEVHNSYNSFPKTDLRNDLAGINDNIINPYSRSLFDGIR